VPNLADDFCFVGKPFSAYFRFWGETEIVRMRISDVLQAEFDDLKAQALPLSDTNGL
jgi:hypothetical protein